MRMLSARWFICGFAATLATVFAIEAVQAHGYGQGRGYVVAESRFGNATVRGAVRHTTLGPQVQLPGGAWIYCRRSCSETLRAETVDFWEAQAGPGGKEQGLLIYLRRW